MTTAHALMALGLWLVLTIATFRANRNERRRG